MRSHAVSVHVQNGEPVEAIFLTLDFHQEGSRWLAECLELGTPAYGSTIEEAQNEALEAVHLHLNEVQKLGFIDEFLQERRVPRVSLKCSRQSSADKRDWEPVLVGT